jgi:hypothetical protein
MDERSEGVASVATGAIIKRLPESHSHNLELF